MFGGAFGWAAQTGSIYGGEDIDLDVSVDCSALRFTLASHLLNALPVPVDLVEQERAPPRQPTTPRFPTFTPKLESNPLTRSTSKEFLKHIANLKWPSDITVEDVERLNISFKHDVPLRSMVRGGSKFQDRPFMHDEHLTAALKDIQITNDEAFPAVLRLPRQDGGKHLRLGGAHAFFVALEQVSQYWDDSKDQYYETEDSSDERFDIPSTGFDIHGPSYEELIEQGGPQKMKQVYKGRRTATGEQMPHDTLVRVAKAFVEMARAGFRVAAYEKREKARLVVCGCRVPVALSFDMGRVPEDRKRARAEGLIGPVVGGHVREFLGMKNDDGTPTKEEVMDLYREVGACLLLAQKRGREGRVDVVPGGDKWWGTKRRWGGGSGGNMPHESDEEPCEDPSKPFTKDVERREKKAEDDEETPPEDETYQEETARLQREVRTRTERLRRERVRLQSELRDITNTMSESASSITPRKRASPEKKADGEEEKQSRKKSKGKKVGMRFKALVENYRKLKLGESLWDQHIEYKAIGKEGPWDDVYVVSAVNCHVSLVRMRVHEGYVRWLEDGTEIKTEGREGDEQENVLYIERSKWFNLLDVAERSEALVGLWRIMSWLFREERDKSEGREAEAKAEAVGGWKISTRTTEVGGKVDVPADAPTEL